MAFAAGFVRLRLKRAQYIGCLLLAACAPAAPAPISEIQVQDFVRAYVKASNADDPSAAMALMEESPTVTSVTHGTLKRGADAIRFANAPGMADAKRFRLTLREVDVTLLGPDAALAVASVAVSGTVQMGAVQASNLPGALTLVVRRTPAGLRLIHEHYSLRAL
jgi:uncharacterized protein (TIGR02246 family)